MAPKKHFAVAWDNESKISIKNKKHVQEISIYKDRSYFKQLFSENISYIAVLFLLSINFINVVLINIPLYICPISCRRRSLCFLIKISIFFPPFTRRLVRGR